MKKLMVIGVLALVGLMIAVPYKTALSHSALPPTGDTGAPGESTCQYCHASYTINSGIGNITISIDTANKYNADSAYIVTVIVNDTTEVTYGFELTALDNSNHAQGTFTITNTSNTILQKAGVPKKYYVGHKNASTTNTWTFKWQAPPIDTGDITFYACGVAANNDGSSTNDYVYSTTLTLKFDTLITTGIKQPQSNNEDITVYPSPATNILNLGFQLAQSSPVTVNLYDLTGKIITTCNYGSQFAGQFKQSLALKNLLLSNGVYIVDINTNYGKQYKKILIENN